MARSLGLGFVLIASLAACSTSSLEFRSPVGSHLNLDSVWVNRARTVNFVSRETFRQVHAQDATEGAACSGELRISGEIDLTRIPSGAENYLIRRDDAVFISVHGYYWIYRYETTTADELAVHYVDITPLQIYDLLEGQPVSVEGISRSGERIFRFQLGIELPGKEEAPKVDEPAVGSKPAEIAETNVQPKPSAKAATESAEAGSTAPIVIDSDETTITLEPERSN